MLLIHLDQRYTHQLAFNVGAATHFDDMTPEDMRSFLTQCGVEDVGKFVQAAVVPLLRISRKHQRSFVRSD